MLKQHKTLEELAGAVATALGDLDPAGQRLTIAPYAWCAWDTLFLPARLGQAARVTSACPVTGELITLTVTPEGLTEISHLKENPRC